MVAQGFTNPHVLNTNATLSGEIGAARRALRNGDTQTAQEHTAEITHWKSAAEKIADEQEQQRLRTSDAALLRGARTLDRAYEALSARGDENIANAQRGQDSIGKAASEIITTGTQMALDAPANLLVPGGSLAMLGARSYGDASQRSRLAGASVGQQIAYGGSVAATEVLSEKMFDGLAGIYGKGAADEIVEKVIGKLTKTPTGKTTLRLLSSAGGEALEEVVSGVIDPALSSIYNGKSARENYSAETAADILHDAIIGGVLGLVGGTQQVLSRVDGAQTRQDAPATAQAEADVMQKTAPEGTVESTSVNTSPAGHSEQEQRVISEYQRAVDTGLVAFINKVRGLKNPRYRNSVRYSVSEVGARQAEAVSQIAGVDAAGFENIITGARLTTSRIDTGRTVKRITAWRI